MSDRYRASVKMPWASPVKITAADGSVRVEPPLTYAQRRNLTKHSSRQVLSREMKDEILLRDCFTCQSCGTTQGPFHIDHIRPFSKGGWQDPRNLQTLCVPCNSAKGASWERT